VGSRSEDKENCIKRGRPRGGVNNKRRPLEGEEWKYDKERKEIKKRCWLDGDQMTCFRARMATSKHDQKDGRGSEDGKQKGLLRSSSTTSGAKIGKVALLLDRKSSGGNQGERKRDKSFWGRSWCCRAGNTYGPAEGWGGDLKTREGIVPILRLVGNNAVRAGGARERPGEGQCLMTSQMDSLVFGRFSGRLHKRRNQEGNFRLFQI